MSYLLRPRIWPLFSPSCRLCPPALKPDTLEAEQKAARPQVFLRRVPRDYARNRQDKRTLQHTLQERFGINPAAPWVEVEIFVYESAIETSAAGTFCR